MPLLWLVPSKKGVEPKERDVLKYYFPRRLPGQSKDRHMKFVKQAKFVCMKPANDGNWELKNGRILKLGLATLEDAINSEKLYSDYFSTTEAEKEELEPVPEAKKCVRKKKKPLPKTNHSSESDGENRGSEVATISNYNIRFATENQDMFTLDEANNIFPINYDDPMDKSLFEVDDGSIQKNIQSGQLTLDGILHNPSNEMILTIQVPTSEANNELAEEGSLNLHQQIETPTNNNNGQQKNCVENSCCKGHQKVLNKIDYFHKKTSKEFALLRQEVSSNRKLLLQLLNLREQPQHSTEDDQEHNEHIQDEPAQLNMVEIDSFDTKFKEIFPITDSEVLIDFNSSMKNEQKFVDYLFSQLKQIKLEDETKTTREILKQLFDFRCLKDFTWQGTKNKQGVVKMKSFEKLHLVVDMITQLLTANYPGCNALKILMKAIQQRTKSAKEAWIKLMEASTAKVQNSVQSVGLNNKNDSTTVKEHVQSDVNINNEKDSTITEHGNVRSTTNIVANNEHDPASCSDYFNDDIGEIDDDITG